MSARERIIPVFVPHLGCPHACVFCDQHRISGSREPPGAERVNSAIAEARAAMGEVRGMQLAFYGGSFTAIPAERQLEYLEAAAPYIESGALSSIRLSTRPDAIDDVTLERLRRYGVRTIELGAQSMSDEVLRLTERGHTAAQVEAASVMIKRAGFRLILQLMTGLPGSDADTDVESAREIAALAPDGVRVYPTVIVRGTELERRWREGSYSEHSVEDAVRVCARILPIFEAAGVPVIRLGLNPTEELSGGEAVAGAYHPALGELVRARIQRDWAERELIGAKPGDNAVLYVPARLLSQTIGQHGENRRWLIERYSLASLKIKPQP